jgi:hypothetical protein
MRRIAKPGGRPLDDHMREPLRPAGSRSRRPGRPLPGPGRGGPACRTGAAAGPRCSATPRRAAACRPGPARPRDAHLCRRPSRGRRRIRRAPHPPPRIASWPRPQSGRRTAGSHVTKRPTPNTGWPCPYQRSADATRPGDNTPRIMRTTGAESHTGPGDRASRAGADPKGNGGRETTPRPSCRTVAVVGGGMVRSSINPHGDSK